MQPKPTSDGGRFQRRAQAAEDAPVAIVGMSCRFADTPDAAALWRNVMERRTALAPLPPELARLPGDNGLFGRPFPKAAACLGPLYSCVPAVLDFPRQINAGENQDLYFAAQLAIDALADAAIRPSRDVPACGFVSIGYAPPFSSATVNWLEHTYFIDQTMEIIERFFPSAPQEALESVHRRLVESIPAPDAQSFLAGTGGRNAAWIAGEGGFSGEAHLVDAASLSGLAALRQAMDALQSGRADVALAGALEPPLSKAMLEGLSGTMSFSSGATLEPYSRNSTGTLPGEGGAFFVLKRRADALRSHDRIYALVKSVEAAALRDPVRDLVALFRRAADAAGCGLLSIDLVEGHGSGDPAKDVPEYQAVAEAWAGASAARMPVGLGSVKSNVGHTFRASAAAGLAKAALALHRRVLPPQAGGASGPACGSPDVYILDEARPLIAGDAAARPRRALAAAYGAGGHAACAVLEEEPEVRT